MARVEPVKDVSFSKSANLTNHVTASIKVNLTSAAAGVLVPNDPFPADKTTIVGSLIATLAGTPSDLNFGDGNAVVSFKASAGLNSLLGVYPNTAELLKDLDPDPNKKILEGIDITPKDAKQLFLLKWGYDISGSAKGSVALGGSGSATFAVDGASDGLFAVIRAFSDPPKSREGVQATIDSWILPRQISSLDDIKAGTWIIAEVDGEIAVKIGAQYGYNFNWIRKVDLGEFSGDVGLKIQAGADAALGFNASGKYLVLVARESLDETDKALRVRIFKMAKKGWDFAFNANLGVTGSTGTLLPEQMDDFVAAVFGTHGAQVIEDLKQFDRWTDPATPLPPLLAGFVADFVTKELSTFAAGEIAKLTEARNRISAFLQNWNTLGHTSATALLSTLQKGGIPIDTLLNFTKQAKNLDEAGLKNLIETELGKAGFSAGPVGKWLEGVATNDILSLLNNSSLLAKVHTAAQAVLDISNGKVLDRLVEFIGEKLQITKVEKIVTEADFNNLDPWLKDKLAKILGSQQVLFKDIDKIRTLAKTVRDKAGELYQQGLKALNSTYTAAFHYTYSKTTTSTALMDVTFDFAKDPALGAFMKMAIQGDFRDLLLSTSPGIVLKTASLTHGVIRQSHVQLVVPYLNMTLDHINQSLASMNLSEDNGRLFYTLSGSDTVIRAHKWASTLTITGKVGTARGIRKFVNDAEVADSMTFAYSYRQALKAARDVQLETQIQPLVTPYFPKAFGGSDAPAKASLHEWIGNLDDFASKISKPLKGNLGDVLLSLDVSLPGKVVAAWFNGAADEKAAMYLEMSKNIQRVMRRFVQFCYFDDPAKYAEISAAPAVFVYGCLPISTQVKVNNGGPLVLNQADDIYWDFEDGNIRQAMVFHPQCIAALALRMAGIQKLLADSDRFKGSAGFYDPHVLGEPLPLNDPRVAALQSNSLHGLLFTEAQTIEHAREAAISLARFRGAAGADPQRAITALEDFGAKVTDAFNNGLRGIVPRLEEFSAMIFLEAARAFDSSLADVSPIARLDTILLSATATAGTADAFLKGSAADGSAVALEQAIVGLT